MKAWTLFLINPASVDLSNLEDRIEPLKDAQRALKMISADETQRAHYEMREAALHDKISALNQSYNSGKESMLPLIEAAKQEAEEERQEKERERREKEQALQRERKTILKLSKAGMDFEAIADMTSKSIEEIKQICNGE